MKLKDMLDSRVTDTRDSEVVDYRERMEKAIKVWERIVSEFNDTPDEELRRLTVDPFGRPHGTSVGIRITRNRDTGQDTKIVKVVKVRGGYDMITDDDNPLQVMQFLTEFAKSEGLQVFNGYNDHCDETLWTFLYVPPQLNA